MSIQTVYTLTFSDPNKSNTIIVPGITVGTGKNNYDTSLELVGPGYIGYGQSIAQNFVRLLENFSGPIPPQHALEGQLWYDTSDPDRKILRVNNGDLNTSKWPLANGIYQQINDPVTQYLQNVKDGDIWVDTSSNQLKIRYGDEWTLVGPSTSISGNKTGIDAQIIESVTGGSYPIILNWVDGNVVEIISYYEFTPRIVIDGFSLLKPGVNLTSKNSAKFNGLADKASSLEISRGVIIKANEVLKNKIPSASRQIHTGTLVVESVNGLSIKRNGITPELKIYADASNSYITFTGTNAFMRVGLQESSYISFNTNGKVGINTTASFLTANHPTLSVNGGATFSNKVTITTSTTSTSTLDVGGSVNISGNTNIAGTTRILGKATVTDTLTVSDIVAVNSEAEIGSINNPFSYIYVSNIGTTGTHVNIFGNVTTATSLASNRLFRVEGVVSTTNASVFNGSQNIVFTTTAHKSLITSQTAITATNDSLTLLVVNTASSSSSLSRISKKNFLSDIYESIFVTGMIVPYGGTTPPNGWAFCSGASVSSADPLYSELFGIIGTRYSSSSTVAGNFQIPNLSTATYITTGTSTGTYLKYIIKI
jgi:hypothetical protein